MLTLLRNGFIQRPAALRWCGNSEPSVEFCNKVKRITEVEHLTSSRTIAKPLVVRSSYVLVFKMDKYFRMSISNFVGYS